MRSAGGWERVRDEQGVAVEFGKVAALDVFLEGERGDEGLCGGGFGCMGAFGEGGAEGGGGVWDGGHFAVLLVVWGWVFWAGALDVFV